jgi:DNA-binding NtrC family response regulator
MRIAPAALDHLASYEWPGNVRELGNVIERATVLAAGEEIQPEDLPLLSARGGAGVDHQDHPAYHEAIRGYQRQVIRQALRKSGGNQAKAADLLGLQRTYLARLVKKLGLQRATSMDGFK